jgi:ATP-dependent Clp protease adaptor protein ClpS
MLPIPELEDAPVAEHEEKTEEPKLFRVLLHNDDYTTMEFVVYVLQQVFNLDEDKAIQVMLNVHVKGIGVARVTELAREHEFPLLCTMERE